MNRFKTTSLCHQFSALFLSLFVTYVPSIFAEFEIERLVLTTDVTPINAAVSGPLLSVDGRYYAFSTKATNLVTGWTGFVHENVYVKDNQTGDVVRVSQNIDGEPVNASSILWNMSADGRYVVFSTWADNLVPNDTNGFNSDIFLADLDSGTLTRVNVHTDGTEANDASSLAAVSDDGRYVAFWSAATNLVDDDINAVGDVFVRDLQLETTTRVSFDVNGSEFSETAITTSDSISGNGRYVTFSIGPPGGTQAVYLRDTQTDTTTLVSHRHDTITSPVNGHDAIISSDGTAVFLLSNSSVLALTSVANVRKSVFKYNVATNTSVQVSKEGPNNDMGTPLKASDDGRYVVYWSSATNVVVGDSNASSDAFITDTQAKTTSLIILDGNGNQVNPGGIHRDISGDGLLVSFHSTADDLVDNDFKGNDDAFIRDIQNSKTTLALPFAVAGLELVNPPDLSSASANGRFVTLKGINSGLSYGDSNSQSQITMLDRQSGSYTLVTRGYPGHFSTAGVSISDMRTPAPVSNNGLVAFMSYATNLVETGATGQDLYLYDTQTDTMTVLTGLVVENKSLTQFAMSADGQYLTFASVNDSLAAGDANSFFDIYLYNTQTAQFTLLSVDSNEVIGGANASSYNPAISEDGNFVIFESDASNLVAGDNNGVRDIFVRDIQAGQTFLVSKNSDSEAGNNSSTFPVISTGGRYASFVSVASNLVASDTNAQGDIFVHDRQTGITTRVSVDSQGTQTSGAILNGPSISPDGRFVVFTSAATNLVDGDTNGHRDVFIHDNVKGTTALVSHNIAGEQADHFSNSSPSPVLTENGSRILFNSFASNLVADDTNARQDIFRASNPIVPIEEVILSDSFEDP